MTRFFKGQKSALGYCFTTTKPTKGLASIYVPKLVSEHTPTILFLHGFGGSFQFYQYFLVQLFPDHIIVCPAFGISTGNINSVYLQECLSETRRKLGFTNTSHKPILMGISAGGLGGFRELARAPEKYSKFICLAAYPPAPVRFSGPIRILAGANEEFVRNGTLTRQFVALKRMSPNSLANTIPGGDHFFLLTHERLTRQILQKWAMEK